MISIGAPYIKEVGDWTELHAKVKISTDTAYRYYEKSNYNKFTKSGFIKPDFLLNKTIKTQCFRISL